MLDGQEITVIGAGIGGLASAIALARGGARVEVLEQSPEIAEVGAGLQITPNGVAVLDALGLHDARRGAATPAGAVVLRDYRAGSRVVEMDLSRHAPEQGYLLFHRCDLIGLLENAARAEGVEITLNQGVTRIAETGNGVTMTLADGSEREVPLVIGADGLHSRLRPLLNGAAAPFFTGQVAWRALVAGQVGDSRDVNVYMGPGRHVVTYPLRGGELVNIVAIQERDAWAEEGWNIPGDTDDLRRVFSMFCPTVTDLLERIETVNVWGLFRHPVAQHWHGAFSALVGDAAHPTLPFLAQGANMALEDAWVLASSLSQLPIPAALARYQEKRRPRVVRVIEAANANARNYHLRNPLVRLAAHSGLRLAGRLAPGMVLDRFDWVHGHDVTAT